MPFLEKTMKKLVLPVFVLAAAALCACSTPTRYVHPVEDANLISVGIDAADFEKAAAEAVSSMLRSGVLDKNGGGRYVLAISTVTNDTMQRIDTDLLIKKIRIDLLNSGKVVVTTAVGVNGPEDPLSMMSRELRDNEEFNRKTTMAKGQMIAPELSLSGKIIQRNAAVSEDEQRVDYYFQLTLTDIRTGLALWEGETVIGKIASNKFAAW